MNIFQYAANEEKMFEKYFSEMSGYERKTTFFSDFSIAEVFGLKAIKDTFKMSVESWKTDPVYIAELALSVNLKSWEWYERGDEKKAKLYSDLFYKTNDIAYKNLDEEGQRYYFNTTD